jgi:hypothetical protein
MDPENVDWRFLQNKCGTEGISITGADGPKDICQDVRHAYEPIEKNPVYQTKHEGACDVTLHFVFTYLSFSRRSVFFK